jgi:hypothetical protein
MELMLKLRQFFSNGGQGFTNCSFPGNPSQISKEADGIAFHMSLISGRNPII